MELPLAGEGDLLPADFFLPFAGEGDLFLFAGDLLPFAGEGDLLEKETSCLLSTACRGLFLSESGRVTRGEEFHIDPSGRRACER